MRYGSTGWFIHDACAKCGFAYGTNCHDPPITGNELWKRLIETWGSVLEEEGYARSRKGILRWMEDGPNPETEPQSVFDWSTTPKLELLSFVGDCP